VKIDANIGMEAFVKITNCKNWFAQFPWKQQASDPEEKNANNLGSNWTIHTSEPIPMRNSILNFLVSLSTRKFYIFFEIFVKIETN
jgi:hypothetical protein